jgi:hypothetical protein
MGSLSRSGCECQTGSTGTRRTSAGLFPDSCKDPDQPLPIIQGIHKSGVWSPQNAVVGTLAIDMPFAAAHGM